MYFWDERYAEPGYAYGTEPNDFLAEVAERIPAGGRVLCLADGEGRNGVFLARRGYAVTSVDLSPVGLRKAEALAAQHGAAITTVHADLAEFPFEEGAWDGVVAIFCHLPEPPRSRVFGAVARTLRPGGAFVFEAYTPRQLAYDTGGPRDTALLYEPDELRAYCAGLRLERLAEVERDVVEGRCHTGRAAVVQVLALR